MAAKCKENPDFTKKVYNPAKKKTGLTPSEYRALFSHESETEETE